MKIRSGFVSNSSSSSFVCDVCGNVESGWDLSMGEAEFVECENGHTFDEHHIYDFDKEEKVENIDFNSDDDDDEDDDEDDDSNTVSLNRHSIPERYCPVCRNPILDRGIIKQFIYKHYRIDHNVIKEKLQKERHPNREVYGEEYLPYILKTYSLNEVDVVNLIKERFKTFKELKEYVRSY